MSNTELIINLLNEIESDTTIEINNNFYKTSHPLVNAVIYLANHYLITEEGYYAIQQIIKAGFDIYPGEQDRFGWLTGCIKLNNGGIIVFG